MDANGVMIPFLGRSPEDNGFFYVRALGHAVGLVVSLSEDGDIEDIEVSVGGKEMDGLIEALGKARAMLGERMSSQLAMIPFVERDSKDEGFFIVKVHNESVGLVVSLMKNGDIQVFVGAKEIDALIEALGKARAMLDTPA
jgi:hypothetical protein